MASNATRAAAVGKDPFAILTDGRIFFGLNADRHTVPDLDALQAGIEESLEELRTLARSESAVSVP